MKNIRRFFSILLSIALILSFIPLECIAAEKVVSDDVVEYSVPLVSMEMPENAISFYEIAGDYYLNLKDIATLTRCTYEEKNNIILLTHGTRELEINIETSELNDSGIKEQGKIKLKEYEGAYLCEAVPMLNYLGAECSINDQLNAFQVLMPTITFWEAFMPDYLDYHFNTEEWMGNQTDVEISLICDIIMDLLDVTNGHGLYSTDEHYEDALYDILNVDLYSYESVQTIVEKENNKMEEFLCSDTFSNVFSQGSEIGQKIFEGYADYYMTAKIAVDEVNRTNQFIKGNYEVAADIGQQINKNVCKQVDLQTVGKNSVGAATLAFDTALSAYKLMCYDQESRTLFSTCITDDVEKFTGYDVEYLQKITDKISSDIKTDQSIVANVVVDKISKWAYSEIKDKGVETAASAFKGGNIYVLAAKVGVMLAEIPLRGTIDAYSDDMDMLWLASTQTDVAQLATRYMLTTLQDEKGSNAEHIEMVKNLMALYYRTTIAFCENAISSCEEFGSAKTKAKTCEYLKQVSDYMAAYLYLMTNCKVVPIIEYSNLSDDVLMAEWINQFEQEISVDLSASWEKYLRSIGEKSAYFIPADYDGDGIQEAFGITGTFDGEMGYYDAKIYYINSSGDIICVRETTRHGDRLYGYLLPQVSDLTNTVGDYLMSVSASKFIVWEVSAYGSGSLSIILGVKNGEAYEPEISDQYMTFRKNDSEEFIGLTSDFSKGFHDYIDNIFIYDENTGEFISK